MSKIIIDTNVFYLFMGSENPKVNMIKLEEILNNHEILVTVQVLHEILSRFYVNEDKIDRVNKILLKYSIMLITEKGNKIKATPIQLKKETIKTKFNIIIEARSKSEAEYGILIYYQVLSYFIYKTLNNDEKKKCFIDNHESASADYIKDEGKKFVKYCNYLKNKLIEGYENNKAKQIFKNEFNSLIYKGIYKYIERVIADTDYKNKLLKALEKSKDNVSEFIVDYKTVNKNTYFTYDRDYIIGFFKQTKQEIDKNLYRYLSKRLAKIINDGGKMDKNDIYDMLIISALEDKEVAIITFDEKMQNFLINESDSSNAYLMEVINNDIS